jgi:hypothetical protein
LQLLPGERLLGWNNDPGFMYSTAGAIYKANPREQMLAQVPADEAVMLLSRAMKLQAGRKI